MAASPAPLFCCLRKMRIPKLPNYHIIMSRNFHGEGNSAYNIVDSNLNALRQRIEVLRKKEKLINTIYKREIGWNYIWEYEDKRKKHSLVLELVELAGLAGSNILIVFIIGSLCMLLLSLILHMHS
ncbi:uncharacterized protein LOC132615090 [Lycium barbarum]|uniref:uncharacterized protein LOC132615090 n=1 Tax=Lycium barbarum TaxID=112863 RepID=UPI00293E2E2C|nr:uncharacterized protein LOC132615090 [Lycium barbarum]